MNPTTAYMLAKAIDADRARQLRHYHRPQTDRATPTDRPSVWSAMVNLRRTGLTPSSILGT
jgi:hypothetical protein